jgi:hypothetical protein
MRNLQRRASVVSIAFFIAVNSDPKVDDSTKFLPLAEPDGWRSVVKQ